MLAISFESSEPSVKDHGELSRAGMRWHNLNILILQNGKAIHLDMHKVFGTYEAARGLVRGGGARSGLLSASHPGLSAREPFPLLGSFASRVGEAPLFFLPSSRGSHFPPPLRCRLRRPKVGLVSGGTSEAPFRRRPLLAPLAVFLAFFFGTS